MKGFLSQVYFDNSVRDYLWFLGIFLVALILKRVLSRYLSNILFSLVKQKAAGVQPNRFYELLKKPLGLFLLLIVIGLATIHLDWPESWKLASEDEFGVRMVISKGYKFLLIFAFTWIIIQLVAFAGLVLLNRAALTESKHDDQLIPFAVEITKVVVAIFGFFIVLGTVFSLNVGSLVAGLGIGGLAVALAAKESLENLFASFTIFLDKPFVVGDLVQVGEIIGTVEKVGFRSTRIRTLERSYLTLPNKKMVDTELDNLSLRTFRRGKFNVGVTYDTTGEQIKAITKDIKEFLDKNPRTNQEGRARFVEFGDSSLNIMVEYFVDTMDYEVYLDTREEINYQIMQIVKSHQSDFAFPSTTVYLQNSN